MKKATILVSVLLVLFGFTVLPVVAFEAPVITLDRVEVASIQPFFVKPKIKGKDGKETVGKYGYSSTMNVAYVLDIKNPNKEPVMLDELSFTITFDGFEVNTVTAYEDAWVPAGKNNQLRVIATNEAFPTIVSLMVGAMNVKRIQDMKTSAGKLVGKWWTKIADFSFPIEIVNGTAVFTNEKGDEVRSTFTGKFGGEKKKPAGSGSK
jgi:hypothetical protein